MGIEPSLHVAEPTATDDELRRRVERHRSSPVPRGTMIGHFMVIDQLGAGACGLVVSAYDPDLDRKVALKVLRPDVVGASDANRARERLLREAKALARITHPNVITVHAVGSVEEQIYVAMEYVDGGTLRDTLSLRKRGWRQVLGLFLPAGRGLAAAHRAGMVHRDFKPANVLVSRDNRVVVTDFGLVSTATEAEGSAGGDDPAPMFESALTETGRALGTPAYMAPEQHAGGSIDPRTDQFAYCVALYEALFGVRPFAGSTLGDLWAAKRQGPIDPPADADVPGWLTQIVLRGLSPEPGDRFATMDELLAAIDEEMARPSRRWLGLGAALLGVALVIFAYQWLTRSPLVGGNSEAQRAALHAELARKDRALLETQAELDRQSRASKQGGARLEALLLRERQLEQELAEAYARLDAMERPAPHSARSLYRRRGCQPGDPDCAGELEPRRRAAPPTSKTPDAAAVRAVFAARANLVRDCVPGTNLERPRSFQEWETMMHGNPVREVGVHVALAADGHVESVTVDAGKTLERACVMHVIRGARFPASRRGGEASYRYRLAE